MKEINGKSKFKSEKLLCRIVIDENEITDQKTIAKKSSNFF